MTELLDLSVPGRRLVEIGDRFHRLTVLAEIKDPKRGTFYRCQCDCGNTKVVFRGHLVSGATKGCGCAKKGVNRTHGLSQSPEYKAWEKARDRCHNPRNGKYPLYGGRGIAFCERWTDSFQNFLDDMGRKPSPAHSLDRRDSNGNYEPTNCRWATDEEQNNNRSSNRFVVVAGKRVTVAQASRLTGVPHATIIGRLDRGMSDAEAVK